jgi:hypothetical protein
VSLRAFHLLFIVLSILMAAGCAWWGFANGVTPLFGVACIIAAAGLSVYGVYVAKKTKKLIL